METDSLAAAAEFTKFHKRDGKVMYFLNSFFHDDLLGLIKTSRRQEQFVYAKKSISSQTFARKQLAKLQRSSAKNHVKIFEDMIRQNSKENTYVVSQLFLTLPELFDALLTKLENLEQEKLELDVV